MLLFHQERIQTFYAFPSLLGGLMMVQWVGWGVWLACCVVLGQWADRLAVMYTRALREGAAVDRHTLAGAAVHACVRAPDARLSSCGIFCALVLAAAALPFLEAPTLSMSTLSMLARVLACGVLLLLGLIDARSGYLPDALTLPLMWAGLLVAGVGHGVAADAAVIGAASGYAMPWALDAAYRRLRGRSGLGGGDMKLVAAMGAWLGWAPLPHLVLLACVGSGLWVAVSRSRRRWSDTLPFGPFLSGAAIFGLVGTPVVQWFF